MLGMIAWRLLALIPVLLVVTFVVFLLVELAPGDAATSVAGGANATPEKIAEVRHELGLDRPVLTRYFDWLGNAVQLDFGKSYAAYNNVAAPDVARGARGADPGVARTGVGGPLRGRPHRHPARHPLRHATRWADRPVECDRDQLRSRHPQLRARVLPHPGVRAHARLVARAGVHEVQREPDGMVGVDRAARDLAGRDRGGFGRAVRRGLRSSTCCSRTTCAPRSRWARARAGPS